jgi:Subtilisin inhibitor-like
VPEPETELYVTLHHPESGPVTRVLRDPPNGGDHPRPAEALAALDAAGDPFAPVPPGTIATMIYGGPETATVTGTWRGRPVDAQFARNDGAQMARWDRVAPLLNLR